jgi:hypothetical protein
MRRPGLWVRRMFGEPGPARTPAGGRRGSAHAPADARPAAAAGGQGFALLAALLIAAIALLATASLVALALSSTSISADDVASARAADLARTGVADALQRLRWGWAHVGAASSPASFGPVVTAGCSYTVTIRALTAADPRPPLDAACVVAPTDPDMVACRIAATGAWGQARRTVSVTALSSPDALPRGLVVGADAVLQADTRLQGCGLYAGADVTGREWVSLSPGADLAYGGLYQQNAVHAVGRIFSGGAEEHATAGAPAADTDADGGIVPPAGLVAPPSAASLGALACHGADPGAALGPYGLDLTLLDRTAPAASAGAAAPADGDIYVLSAADVALLLFGERPAAPQACPVTIVVLGDCVVGDGPAGPATALEGALVVTGTLTVSGPLSVAGGLYAGRLVVRAPLTVDGSGLAGATAAPGRATVRDVWWRW